MLHKYGEKKKFQVSRAFFLVLLRYLECAIPNVFNIICVNTSSKLIRVMSVRKDEQNEGIFLANVEWV